MNQFPQPTRPVRNCDLTPLQFPQASLDVTINDSYSRPSVPGQEFQFNLPDNLMPQPTAKTEEEKHAIEDLIRLISEWYEKLPERIRSQINLDKLDVSSNNTTEQQGFQFEPTKIHGDNEQMGEFKHILERFKINAMHINTSRGVNGPGEELWQKLERFKIRTVQLGEVAEKEAKR
ncbi:hypothetical protein DITRI_Ditri12bG0139100 [Diplodiscus trichospermus]